ncbi:dTMP kinase [uncultured Cardiobacterium sp.]|uniref:dTMP kinase n=1 Tax=uncultured Cardiobacterium sp. TaxID=417619 RepID=UPI002607C65D|nr:dTMP kinase [uncultured Cardiobacterium sp.]
MTGRFITLDGGEGVGKTTQLAHIRAWCSAQHLEARFGREPGGTPFGERLRAILLDPATRADPVSELLLILAARRAHLEQTILPCLARGAWYISDRYRDATYAYQHYGRGIPAATIAALEAISGTDREPDLSLILGSSSAIACDRLAARGQSADRFESENSAFHERVAAGYRARAAASHARWIDGEGDPDTVFARIRPHLEALLP